MRIAYLQEENFREQMRDVVEPYLHKYRRCGRFVSFDGTKIFYSAYVQKHARGNIVISHGFCEFSEKYNEMIFYFLQAGYSVFMPEHRGHGRSERKLRNLSKVHVKSFAEYVYDLHEFVKRIVEPHKNEMILFAHSMGGAIAALYLQTYPKDFQKAILSAPMIQMKVTGVPYPVAMLIAHVHKAWGLGRAYAAGQHGFRRLQSFETGCCLSKERHLYAYEKRLHNKRCRNSGATYSWVAAAGKASAYVQDADNIRKIKIPVLVFAAGKESLVNTDEICRFAGKLPHARFVWMLQAKHEIFNAGERERLQYYDEIFAFLDDRIYSRAIKFAI